MAVCLDLLQQLLSSICTLDIRVHHQPAYCRMLEETTASHVGGIARQHGCYTVHGRHVLAVHYCMQLLLRVDQQHSEISGHCIGLHMHCRLFQFWQ